MKINNSIKSGICGNGRKIIREFDKNTETATIILRGIAFFCMA